MSDASTRLRAARENAGFETATQAAERFGWAAPTYMGHENGSRGFNPTKAATYARAFKVSPEWLLFGRSDSTESVVYRDGDELLPVYNVQASAGHGSLIDHEEIVSSIAFPPGYLKKLTKANPENLAIIGVKGDSMVPSLQDDDLVMLDTSKTDLSFDGLFVMRDNGDGLLVKRIGRASRKGHIMVISDNRDLYPPIERAMADIEVIGKVIWMGKKV